MPQSRPFPSLGRHCHELRIVDEDVSWRIVYRADADAVVVVEVFAKKTREAPAHVMRVCRSRLRAYDALAGERE